jgi:hypothetical protein
MFHVFVDGMPFGPEYTDIGDAVEYAGWLVYEMPNVSIFVADGLGEYAEVVWDSDRAKAQGGF